MKVIYSQRDPEEWECLLSLLTEAVKQNKLQELLSILLTYDEKNSLGLRVQIIRLLLDNRLSQREIQQMLNTSAATITRGSNLLKTVEPALLDWINQQLNDNA